MGQKGIFFICIDHTVRGGKKRPTYGSKRHPTALLRPFRPLSTDAECCPIWFGRATEEPCRYLLCLPFFLLVSLLFGSLSQKQNLVSLTGLNRKWSEIECRNWQPSAQSYARNVYSTYHCKYINGFISCFTYHFYLWEENR